MKDASGHEHIGKGSPQGGQFGKGGGGGSGEAEKVHQGREPRPAHELHEAAKHTKVAEPSETPVQPTEAQIRERLDALYPKAEAAKHEVDTHADRIAEAVDHGSTVIKPPLKGKERALEKCKNDYGGDVSRLKDLARNTIMGPEMVHKEVKSHLEKLGAKVKVIDSASDPMGYSGMNASVQTKTGMYAEIQVNSAHMIYAKEPKAIAMSIIGETRYNEIADKVGVPGGLGHKFYEEYRSLPEREPRRVHLESQSKAYYQQIRSAMM